MDRRRTPGLTSLSSTRLQTHHYTTHGAKLRTNTAASLSTQLSVFQSLVHNFALTHSREIRANAAFRTEFARMCAALGVDFLGSTYHGGGREKGEGSVWSALLGGSQEFYMHLAMTIVDICRATRGENGGLISVDDLRGRVERGRLIGSGVAVQEGDIEAAVSALGPLGGGIGLVRIGKRRLLRSVPMELNGDQSRVLEVLGVVGGVSVGLLEGNLGWGRERAGAVLEDLMAESLVWVDGQTGGEDEYWSPAFLGNGHGLNGVNTDIEDIERTLRT